MVRAPKLDHYLHITELQRCAQYVTQVNTPLREEFAQLVSEKKRLKNHINWEWHESKCLNDLKWKTLYVGAEKTSIKLCDVKCNTKAQSRQP